MTEYIRVLVLEYGDGSVDARGRSGKEEALACNEFVMTVRPSKLQALSWTRAPSARRSLPGGALGASSVSAPGSCTHRTVCYCQSVAPSSIPCPFVSRSAPRLAGVSTTSALKHASRFTRLFLLLPGRARFDFESTRRLHLESYLGQGRFSSNIRWFEP